MNLNKYHLGGAALLVILAIGFIFFMPSAASSNEVFEGKQITVHYSLSCGCCVNFIGYLRDLGLKPEAHQEPDPNTIKEKLNIPQDMRSCHTTVIGDYFIEGHMPIEAVEKLLKEKPEIDGIALPGMPSGSPGMPGLKSEPFKVYAIKEGKAIGIFTEIK